MSTKVKKILIIGQAPPAVKQTYPYDTTMLYDWFSEIGISKPDAQEIFEFEAMVGEFPGHNPGGGHRVPKVEEMHKHYHAVLADKIREADCIILLGRVPQDYFNKFITLADSKKKLSLIHPSKLNWNIYQRNKEKILSELKEFVYSSQK